MQPERGTPRQKLELRSEEHNGHQQETESPSDAKKTSEKETQDRIAVSSLIERGEAPVRGENGWERGRGGQHKLTLLQGLRGLLKRGPLLSLPRCARERRRM
jgi:hypothetical protein